MELVGHCCRNETAKSSYFPPYLFKIIKVIGTSIEFNVSQLILFVCVRQKTVYFETWKKTFLDIMKNGLKYIVALTPSIEFHTFFIHMMHPYLCWNCSRQVFFLKNCVHLLYWIRLISVPWADPEGGGGAGGPDSLKNHNNIAFLSILVRIPWNH